ncbi:MAG: hypothetical protein IT464_02650 [Planctomycetes bacterium]|nr:hypothetical protein [Planctomycetota bacterium]
MAKIDVICPFCQRLQAVPENRLEQPWLCLVCRGTIDDPFLHKKKGPPPQLAIPLHGKIISASGITNLSEIVAASEAYGGDFEKESWAPGRMQVGDYSAEYEEHKQADKRQSVLWIVLVAVLILAGLGSILFWVVLPMM